MKKIFAVCALAGMMVSCGSVLTLNNEYTAPAQSVAPVAQPETVAQVTTTETSSNAGTALLGGLLGSLADKGSTAANNDGTALTSGGVVSGLLGSILNAFTTVNANTIVGTWNFKGSAFVFESENALAALGSDAIATQLETKVDQYLAKFGVKEGSCSIIFNEDKTFQFVMGDRYVNGNYELNVETKELKMTFGMLATTAILVYDAGTINLVYQSDGLLRILKAVGAKGGNTSLALLGALLDQYDGLRIGMAFAK